MVSVDLFTIPPLNILRVTVNISAQACGAHLRWYKQ